MHTTTTTTRRKRYLAAAAAGILITTAAGSVAAAKPPPSGDPEIKVVASGLNSPRGLSFGPGGILYVAEAGTGGDGPCAIGPEGDEVCFGSTGSITAVWGKHQWRVVDDLPSLADEAQFSVTGPHDVAWSPLGLVVPVGLGADPADRAIYGDDGASLGTIVRVGLGGSWSPLADLAAFEAEHDPDQGQPGVEGPDSNPMGVVVHGSTVTATDAGGNSVLRIKPRWRDDADIDLVATLPFQFADAPPFLGLPPGTQIPVQPVPTGIVRHGDSYYVGQLTGFPFPVGGASVYKIRRGAEPVAVADGFTNIIDVAVDSRGRLLVLEIFTNGLLAAEQDPSGALWRVERDGAKTLIADGADGLLAPSGLAIGRDGAYYVSNKGVFGAGQGEVLRIRP